MVRAKFGILDKGKNTKSGQEKDQEGISFSLTPERLMKRCTCRKWMKGGRFSFLVRTISPWPGESFRGIFWPTSQGPTCLLLLEHEPSEIFLSAMVLLLSPTGKSQQVCKVDILLKEKKRLYMLRSKNHPKNLKNSPLVFSLMKDRVETARQKTTAILTWCSEGTRNL